MALLKLKMMESLRRLILVSLVPVAVTAQQVMVPPGNSTCWSTARGIVERELLARNDDDEALLGQRRTYFLCSDKTYRFGQYSKDVFQQEEPQDLDWPLVVFNPNLHISCAFDCTFDVGADNAYLVYAPRQAEMSELAMDIVPTADNLLLEGIKFTSSETFTDSYIVTLGSPALGVTIKDCMFDGVSDSNGAIVSLYNQDDEREGDDQYQTVLVQDSSFVDSVFGASAAVITGHFAEPGTIPEEGWPLTSLQIQRCRFINLVNGEDADFEDTVVTMAPYSSMTVSDSCFTDNKSQSGSVIRANGGSFSSVNNYGMNNVRLESDKEFPENCVGAISLDDLTDNSGSCLEFDAQICALGPSPSPEEISEAPSASPSMSAAPVAAIGAPSSEPNNGVDSTEPSSAPSSTGDSLPSLAPSATTTLPPTPSVSYVSKTSVFVSIASLATLLHLVP